MSALRLQSELEDYRGLVLPRDFDRTQKFDMRTNEGKAHKARLCREVIRLREEGYPFAVIGEAVGVDPSTLAMWVLMAGHAGLVHAPTQHRDRPEIRTRVRREREAVERKRRREVAALRRANIARARREYRAAKREGRLPSWHAAPRMPQLDSEQQRELDRLVGTQERELRREYLWHGERPVRSPSAGGTRSLDELVEPREFSDTGPGIPFGDIVLGVVPSAEAELLKEEFAERLDAEVGGLTLDDAARLDESTASRLRDKLREAGLVHIPVQRKERERLQDPVPHRGQAPAPIGRGRMGVGSKRKRREKIDANRHSRPSQKPRRGRRREKVIYDWKAAA